jgi:hypothetical protein
LPIVCPNVIGKKSVCAKTSPLAAKTNANKSIAHMLGYSNDKTMLLIVSNSDQTAFKSYILIIQILDVELDSI